MGTISYAGQYRDGANAALVDILTRAAEASGYNVEFKSGFRSGDPRQHGKKNAIDVTLIDPKTGKEVPDYQHGPSFRIYEEFAQTARQIQRAEYPDLTDKFRWGGYFSSKTGLKGYGAVDLMHFDLAGDKLGMVAGSWEKGLTAAARKAYPGAVSVGFNDHPVPPMNVPMVGTALDAIERQSPMSRTSAVAYAPSLPSLTSTASPTSAEGISAEIFGRPPNWPADWPRVAERAPSLRDAFPVQRGVDEFSRDVGSDLTPGFANLMPFATRDGATNAKMRAMASPTAADLSPKPAISSVRPMTAAPGTGASQAQMQALRAVPVAPKPLTSAPGAGISMAQRNAMAAVNPPPVTSGAFKTGQGIAGTAQLPAGYVPKVSFAPSLPEPMLRPSRVSTPMPEPWRYSLTSPSLPGALPMSRTAALSGPSPMMRTAALASVLSKPAPAMRAGPAPRTATASYRATPSLTSTGSGGGPETTNDWHRSIFG